MYTQTVKRNDCRGIDRRSIHTLAVVLITKIPRSSRGTKFKRENSRVRQTVRHTGDYIELSRFIRWIGELTDSTKDGHRVCGVGRVGVLVSSVAGTTMTCRDVKADSGLGEIVNRRSTHPTNNPPRTMMGRGRGDSMRMPQQLVLFSLYFTSFHLLQILLLLPALILLQWNVKEVSSASLLESERPREAFAWVLPPQPSRRTRRSVAFQPQEGRKWKVAQQMAILNSIHFTDHEDYDTDSRHFVNGGFHSESRRCRRGQTRRQLKESIKNRRLTSAMGKVGGNRKVQEQQSSTIDIHVPVAGEPAEPGSDRDHPPMVSKQRKRKSTSTATTVKATATDNNGRKKRVEEVIHWRDDSDLFLWEHHNAPSADNSTSIILQSDLLRFTVRGNPLPLRRHRTSRGFVYNPSAKAQESFRRIVREMISNSDGPGLGGNQTTTITDPLFGSETALVMTLVFRTKRPNADFIGGKPGLGRLRGSPGSTSTTAGEPPSQVSPPPRTDVDNLAKFVLDSLNGLLYEDDRQIVSLHATKFRDNQDLCRGSTEVCLRVIHDNDLERLLNRTFELF